MTVRCLARLIVGLALALFMSAIWSAPSEAHSGHHEPAATTQRAAGPAAASDVRAEAPEQTSQAVSRDCGGYGGQPGSDQPNCCGDTCHAVISTEMAPLKAVTLGAADLAAIPAPTAVSGPTVHIRRPPRSDAAPVG